MRILAKCAAVLLASSAFAEDFAIGDLVVENVQARETPQNAMAGGGYLTITNSGATADRLIAVEADFPRVEIHTTELVDDVARMVQIDGIEIAPGETVTLKPGGPHVMFMGLDGDPFEVGETVPATLVFETAGRLDVAFSVETLEAITGGEMTGHDGHGHDDHGHGDHSGHGDADAHAGHGDASHDHK